MKIRFIPKTEIIAPYPASKAIIQRYIKLGWLKIPEGHEIHRVFPRNDKGQAYIRQTNIQGALRRVSLDLAKRFHILEGCIVVGTPLIGVRPILDVKTDTPRTTECYEYIDPTFRDIYFTIEAEEPLVKDLLQALIKAGELGVGARRREGYGRFTIEATLPKKREPK